MEGLIETQRVYQELGSPKELQSFIDNPPSFLSEVDLQCRLFHRKGEVTLCRIYAFDGAIMIGRANIKETKDITYDPVIMAESPVTMKKNSMNVALNSNLLQKDEKEIEMVVEDEPSEFCLVFYGSYSQVYPSFYCDPVEDDYCIKFTQICMKKEQDQDSLLVDETEMWIEKSQYVHLSTFIGGVQTNLWKVFGLNVTPKPGSRPERTMGRSFKSRTGRTRKRVSRTSQKGKRRSKEELDLKNKVQRPSAFDKSKRKGLKPKSRASNVEEIQDEPDKYLVVLGEHQYIRSKGFTLNENFIVTDVTPWGLAMAAGVHVGDRVEMINNEDINSNLVSLLDFPERVAILFSRSNDLKSSTARKDNFNSDTSGKASLIKEKTDELEEIFFLEKKPTIKGPHFDDDLDHGLEDDLSDDEEKEEKEVVVFHKAVKNSLQRMLNNKTKVWNRLRKSFQIQVTTHKDKFEELVFKQEKEKVVNFFEKIVVVFPDKEEKRCIRALQEIYTTESGYLQSLFSLIKARNIVSSLTKVPDSNEGHASNRRIKRQGSKEMVQAVPDKDLNKIFLNVKSLISIHSRIENGLRLSLMQLDKKSREENISVEDVLSVFCKEFSKIAPFLSMYTNYIQRYSNAVEFQKVLRGENRYFKIGIA